MKRIAILTLLALCAPTFAQDKARTLKEEQEQNVQLQSRIDALTASHKDEADAMKAKEQQRDAALDKREKDAAGYLSGEELPADEVRSRIHRLRKRIQSLEQVQETSSARLSKNEGLLLNLIEERDESQGALLAAREADTDKSAARNLEWEKVKQERAQLYESLRAALRTLTDTLRAHVAAEAETMSELVKALAMHRRENLFLRSPDRLDWDKTRTALADLRDLPAWIADASSKTGTYFADPDKRSGILRWAGSAIAIVLIVVLVGRGMRTRALRLEKLASDEESSSSKAVHAAYRFGRRGVHLLVIYLVPWSAAAMLPDIPDAIATFLLGIARFATLYYLVWSVYRELLRPGATDSALLQLEPWVRRRVGLAIVILLTSALAGRIPSLALHAAGYENDTAYLLLELLLLLGSSIALSGIVFRRSIFTTLLPKGDAAWARLVSGFGRFARPLLQLVLPLLFVLTALRFQALADVVASYSMSLLAVIIAATLAYQLLKTLWLQFIEKRYAGEEESDPARAARGAGLFALRVAVFMTAFWTIPFLAGNSDVEFRETFQIGLPFQGADSGITVWNLAAAIITGIIVWFGSHHAKALLQYQVLARTGIDRSTQYTIATLFGYAVLTFGMVIALRQVVNLSALGTIVAALSVGIGFGMQDIVSNFISGIILLFERPIRVGDTIEVGANRGLVRTINIRATTVQTRDNVFILVPNRALISTEVVNYGYDDPKIRIAVPVGVSYSSDPEQVRDILLKVAAEQSTVLKHPVPLVQFTEFGDSSLNFRLLAWIQRAEQRNRIVSDLNFAIFKEFNEANIEIPFPQRDLHIRSAEGLTGRGLPEPKPDPEPEPEPEPEA